MGSIMPSYSSWNGVKASGSHRLLTEILKGELGFEGFLISDYNAIDELPGDYRSDVKSSVNAGMDMVMVPEKYREFIATLKSLVEARRGADVAHRRRGTAHPAREVRHGPHEAGRAPHDRPAAAWRASARRRTAPWRGAPCASRSCC